MTSLTFYGDVKEIGGNKILLENPEFTGDEEDKDKTPYSEMR